MNKYIMKWLDGSRSAMALTKEQTVRALNNWIDKDVHWGLITVENTKNGKVEVFSQSEMKQHITDLSV